MNLEINNKIQSRHSLYQIIPSLTSITNNITKLALPVLGIWALSCILTAEAGKAEYDFCMQTCPSLLQYAAQVAGGWTSDLTYDQAVAICDAACKFNLLW